MARDKVKRAFVWIRKTLRIIDRTTLPAEILGEIRPTLDTFGWDRLASTEFATASSPGATTLVQLAAVPEDEAHLFVAAHVTHDDPVGSKDITLMLEDLGGNRTALTTTVGPNASFFIALLRPILVAPGARLIGVSRNAIAGGSNFVIAGLFARLDVGEYIPPV